MTPESAAHKTCRRSEAQECLRTCILTPPHTSLCQAVSVSGQGFKPTTPWELAGCSSAAAAWLNRRWFNSLWQSCSHAGECCSLWETKHCQMKLYSDNEVCEVVASPANLKCENQSVFVCLQPYRTHFKTFIFYF